MKDLIIKVLDDAINKLDKITPATKRVEKSICIYDVHPLDLPAFMKDNNIPDDAYFSNGPDDVSLSWFVDVPLTDSDKLNFRRKRFSMIAATCIYGPLTHNGYERVGFNSASLKAFADTTVYDMYVNKELDRLIKFYSLMFKLKSEIDGNRK